MKPRPPRVTFTFSEEEIIHALLRYSDFPLHNPKIYKISKDLPLAIVLEGDYIPNV